MISASAIPAEIAAMTGFGPAAPRLRDYTVSYGLRVTGFLSALTGNAVARASSRAGLRRRI